MTERGVVFVPALPPGRLRDGVRAADEAGSASPNAVTICKRVSRPMGRVDPVTISIRLTDEEEARVDGLARCTGRSKSFYVRAALHEYLTDLEDAFAADAAIDAFEAAGRRGRPLSAVKAETVAPLE